tara:strand:+ start:471 stop:665 length:195 start_codon:yes stop_codon:yes gene_type:complete
MFSDAFEELEEVDASDFRSTRRATPNAPRPICLTTVKRFIVIPKTAGSFFDGFIQLKNLQIFYN